MTWLGQRRRPSGSSGWNASMKEKKTSPTRSVKASLLLPCEARAKVSDKGSSHEPCAWRVAGIARVHTLAPKARYATGRGRAHARAPSRSAARAYSSYRRRGIG
eukprot:5054382-Pleurochrysis_carterae.AAC.1